MIERAFLEARQHKNNKRNTIRQFALDRAMDLLKAAGVVDPALKRSSCSYKAQRLAEESLYFIPEGVGVRWPLEIGGKPADQLEAEAKRVRTLSEYALDMAHNPKFTTLEKVTPVELIKLPVSALGLPGTPTTRQIFERVPQCRVEDMALVLCRAEVGLHQAIKDTAQPLNDYYYIMHEPLADRDGDPHVFGLERDDSGLWLNDGWALPVDRWIPDDQVVFALRKVKPVKS
ncbi:hypothetical protein A3C32_01680 [Candidatus Daviesbacteria bacterium RIFCSPHIGHO2_02_FULL_41_14]|uniref:Uncharacterized protein n=1 Tax=Candidatus Daviesbacteria bacterium RIFCSPLOWO2_01_FULL_40_24 TaxID=1797787 RepID=A0A1F5MK71_9BACT|nr:MAG: hypothetical protein A2780_01910 [Candidatus Daviesbacteria bacterium RIFCSPHIGHO2_01_FULL_41_45]OGE34861.1 MAG: hypothetical protein A3C32_01680 [Candidatus Daviesbacteria bacterium RIFCSPHIGHO2_02_FULL_41_14]OGE65762.1 MAG: hypothetical protein A3B49_00025 [Candidatus Daviesbacteria bacterium RIFCSPLOWO2_01_FULL_40_24]